MAFAAAGGCELRKQPRIYFDKQLRKRGETSTFILPCTPTTGRCPRYGLLDHGAGHIRRRLVVVVVGGLHGLGDGVGNGHFGRRIGTTTAARHGFVLMGVGVVEKRGGSVE
jgi:hypothetical protein